jgi:hypothetical protein
VAGRTRRRGRRNRLKIVGRRACGAARLLDSVRPMFGLHLRLGGSLLACLLLSQCAGTMGGGAAGGSTLEEQDRRARIAAEPTGDFFYGRRYYVEKTRFWGYLRKPRQPWNRARLVVFREDRMLNPDRLPEQGPPDRRYGFDNNFEYRIKGYYTGNEVYDPNSNQFLPEFMLTGYELLDREPGWLFRPDDRYDPVRLTLVPR